MLKRQALVSALAGAFIASPVFAAPANVCQTIAAAISPASDVYFPGQVNYLKDIKHWASSSTQASECSVQPGTAADVGVILQILGNAQKPFAVKGGGHASNPGWSSSPGVMIAMSRFDEVNYDQSSNTVTIGTGLIWDDVYEALEPFGVGVVGGRVPGVGVAGFSLGGGYGWTTNQYGLTVDTITQFELVKPDGIVVTVTQQSDSELFFGLKGGQNNFGIVTRITLQAHPQGQVWGGLITYGAFFVDAVNAATAAFASQVTDPKASLINSINIVAGQSGITLLLFYDGPSPPTGIFDAFLSIPHVTKSVGPKSFLDLVKSAPAQATAGTRAIFQAVPTLEYSSAFLDAVKNESLYWGAHLLGTNIFISYAIEPFLPTAFQHLGSNAETAYPPASARPQVFKPTNIYYAWSPDLLGLISLLELDKLFYKAIRDSSRHLTNVAEGLGQNGVATAPLYPNYAIFDTPLERLYSENDPRLQALKATVDPQNVMGLAGGFKF